MNMLDKYKKLTSEKEEIEDYFDTIWCRYADLYLKYKDSSLNKEVYETDSADNYTIKKDSVQLTINHSFDWELNRDTDVDYIHIPLKFFLNTEEAFLELENSLKSEKELRDTRVREFKESYEKRIDELEYKKYLELKEKFENKD